MVLTLDRPSWDNSCLATPNRCNTNQPTGPYYLSEEERIRQRHDRPTGRILTKNKTKEILLEDLKGRGINVSGTVVQLKEIARSNNIPLVFQLPEILKGWEGQPKGMLQVLWERGFIDGSKSEKYPRRSQGRVWKRRPDNFLQDDDGTTNGFY